MKEQDLRTPSEIFDDLLADEYLPEEIAARLSWSPHQVRSQYLRVCREMGVNPDEE